MVLPTWRLPRTGKVLVFFEEWLARRYLEVDNPRSKRQCDHDGKRGTGSRVIRATIRMLATIQIRLTQLLLANVGIASLLLSMSSAATVHAGILQPDEIKFTAEDLERSLSIHESYGAGSSSRHSDFHPASNDERDQRELFGLKQANLPSSGSSPGSSSSSSSTTSGSMTAGAIASTVNYSSAIRDDSPLGRLAEGLGLTLPDPPGTDLLRPPRRIA
jgi:hypothetical protein